MEYNARRFSIFRPVAMHHPAEHSPLGKSSQYVSQYAPELLFPIPRAGPVLTR